MLGLLHFPDKNPTSQSLDLPQKPDIAPLRLLVALWAMRFFRFLRKALSAYWRAVTTPETDEQKAESSTLSF
jgi:hypothetical protein